MHLLLTAAVLPLVLAETVRAEVTHGDVAASYQQREQGAGAGPVRTPQAFPGFHDGGPAAQQRPKSDLGILTGAGRRLFAGRRAADAATKDDRQVAVDLDGIKQQAAADQCADSACEPELCGCVAGGGNAAACAAELDAVCQGAVSKGEATTGEVFSIDECVPVPQYYDNVYCPFAACLVAGGSYAACDCGFYQDSCETYGEDPEFKDRADTRQHCAAHACCQSHDDDEGKATCLASFTGVVLAADAIEAPEEPVEEPVVEEPVVEEPVVEEPVVEEPVVEEPVVEEPVVEEPVVEEPVAEEPVVEEPAAEPDLPVVVVETPVADPVKAAPPSGAPGQTLGVAATAVVLLVLSGFLG